MFCNATDAYVLSSLSHKRYVLKTVQWKFTNVLWHNTGAATPPMLAFIAWRNGNGDTIWRVCEENDNRIDRDRFNVNFSQVIMSATRPRSVWKAIFLILMIVIQRRTDSLGNSDQLTDWKWLNLVFVIIVLLKKLTNCYIVESVSSISISDKCSAS